MNKIRKIYYPVLAIVFVIALTLGLVSSQVYLGAKKDRAFVDNVKVHMEVMENIHNSYESTNQMAVRNYIRSTLIEKGIYNAGGNKSEDYADAEIDGACFVVQDATLSAETAAAMSKDEDELFYAVKDVANIVVVIPGQSDEVVLFTANYDSAAKSESGLECMQAAAMLQTVIELGRDYDAGKLPKRTLLFVFTDAEHEGAYGAYAFRYQFKGFNEIASKVRYAINFGAQGTGALAATADKLSVSDVKGLSSGLNDVIDGIYEGVSDYDVYDDVARLNVFFSGSKDYLNTSRDTIKNVSDAKIKAMGGVMNSLVSAYGLGDKGETNATGTFAYMGLAFSYSNIVSYVLGAIAVVLLILAILMIIRNGKKGGLLNGILAQIVAVVLTAVVLYASYFVLTLMLAGFGVVPINALITIRYMNVGLFVSSLVLAFAAYAGVFLVMRRFYKVKATDAARGGAILLMILGIVMSFVMPSASILFAITAVLEGVMLNIASLCAKNFKAKHQADIERLFLYTIPLIVLTPAAIPVMMLASYSLSAVYFPLILMAAVIAFSVIAPYFGLLKPAMSKAFAKLPKHTIRVERVVTEQVEGAKKGRFEEVTHKKVVNEKVEWNYRNRYGVAILGILSAFLIIMFAVCPTYHFSTNIVDTYSYREALKDNAIVYYWEQLGIGNAATEKLRIYDQVAYSFFGRMDNGFTWDSSLGAYEKSFIGNSNSLHGTATTLNITSNAIDTLTFTPYDSATDSFIDITLSNVSNVTEIVIDSPAGRFEIENNAKKTIRLELPYDNNAYGEFTIRFVFTGDLSVGVDYYQYVYGERTAQKMSALVEYTDVRAGFSGASFRNDISCGMIFHRENSYSLKNN